MPFPEFNYLGYVNKKNSFSFVILSIYWFYFINLVMLYPIFIVFGLALMFIILLCIIYKVCLESIILLPFTLTPPLKTLKDLKVISLFDKITGNIFNDSDFMIKVSKIYFDTLEFSADFIGIYELELEYDMNDIFSLEKLTEIKENFTNIKNNILELRKNKENIKNNKENIKNKECPIGKVLNKKTNICIKNTAYLENEDIIEDFSLRKKKVNEYTIEGFSNEDKYSFVNDSTESVSNVFKKSYNNDANSVRNKVKEEDEKNEKQKKDLEKLKKDNALLKIELANCNSALSTCNVEIENK